MSNPENHSDKYDALILGSGKAVHGINSHHTEGPFSMWGGLAACAGLAVPPWIYSMNL
jgi:hypothetical protein